MQTIRAVHFACACRDTTLPPHCTQHRSRKSGSEPASRRRAPRTVPTANRTSHHHSLCNYTAIYITRGCALGQYERRPVRDPHYGGARATRTPQRPRRRALPHVQPGGQQVQAGRASQAASRAARRVAAHVTPLACSCDVSTLVRMVERRYRRPAAPRASWQLPHT